VANSRNYLFSSESVSEGHPDKVCDRISDAVVDLYMAADPHSRVAIETLVTSPALRSSYGRAARRLTVARFSAEAIGRQTVDLYRNLVKRGGPT